MTRWLTWWLTENLLIGIGAVIFVFATPFITLFHAIAMAVDHAEVERMRARADFKTRTERMRTQRK